MEQNKKPHAKSIYSSTFLSGRLLMDPNGEHEKERVPLRNAATFVIDGKDMVEVNRFGLLL